jgi:DNA-binding transcriptional MerR regulator
LDKAPDAFRTISEVADDLDIPQHVLRFWETRFSQIKPMKRSGGRRYYRPDDIDLLRGIRRLLYGEGYTIRGVQRILKEHGVKSVQGLVDVTVAPPFSSPDKAFRQKHAAPVQPPEPAEVDAAEDVPTVIRRDPELSMTPRANYVARPQIDPQKQPVHEPDLALRDEVARLQQERMEQQRVETRRREQDRLERERIDLDREQAAARRLAQERLEIRQREREERKATGLKRVLDELLACRKVLDAALKPAEPAS